MLDAEISFVYKCYFDFQVVALDTDNNTRMSISGFTTRSSRLLENAKFSILEGLTNMEDLWEQIGIKDEDKVRDLLNCGKF